jgi:hypothetical protein
MMGSLTSFLTEKAADRLATGTTVHHALQQLNLTDHFSNANSTATDVLAHVLHTAATSNGGGSFEIRVSMDIAPNLRELVEKLFVFIPITLFLLFLVLAVAWHTMSCAVNGRASSNAMRRESKMMC